LSAERVAIARTLPAEEGNAVRTIQAAMTAALLTADHLIYVETQYFTSRTLTSVLLQRLAAADRPRLQVLVVMPRGADNSKEKFALGDLQSAMLSELEQAATAHGHELRFLCSAVDGTDCDAVTFIHSKLLIVDDQLLCIGSANITERSMSVDSELCLLWQADAGSPLAADIQHVRASLLAEHSGRPATELLDLRGLTTKLDYWLEQGSSRLRVCHFDPTSVSPLKQAIFDPGAPSQAG
jgi:phospholipase D1/2